MCRDEVTKRHRALITSQSMNPPCDCSMCIMPLLRPNANSSAKRSGRRYVPPLRRIASPRPALRIAQRLFSLTLSRKKRSIKVSKKHHQLPRDGARRGADLSSCAEERRHDAQSAYRMGISSVRDVLGRSGFFPVVEGPPLAPASAALKEVSCFQGSHALWAA